MITYPLTYHSEKGPPKPRFPNPPTRWVILDARHTIIADDIWYEDWAKALVEAFNEQHDPSKKWDLR